MDLYKIKYDISTPDIDQLTINKDSKFAIQLELIQPKNFNVQAADDTTGGDYPVLIIKKSDGSEDDYYYTDLTIDEYNDEEIYTYIWKIEDKFNQDISCCVDLFVYYYNEETEEENEYWYSSTCVCKVACKDASIAFDAVSQTPYTEATSIRAGLNSKNSGSNSVAIGADANTGDSSIAIGFKSDAELNGIAIGNYSKSTKTNAIAMGEDAEANSIKSIAIGKQAKIENNLSGRIQLGTGTLSTDNVLMQVKEFPLLNTDGNIPKERLPGTGENPLRGLIFIDENNSGRKYSIGILDGQLVVGEY